MDRQQQLRQVRVYSSDLVTDHGMVGSIPFRASAHHVAEIFSDLLPKGYVLDGSSMIQVTVGPRGEEPLYSSKLGSSEIFVEPFDFHAYGKLTLPERQRTILDLVENSLCSIANLVCADAAPIREAAQAVRSIDFVLEREIKKLGKSLPSGLGRIGVYRQLSAALSEAWVARVVLKSGATKDVLMREPGSLDLSEYFHKSSWQGTDFIVADNLGFVRFRLPAEI